MCKQLETTFTITSIKGLPTLKGPIEFTAYYVLWKEYQGIPSITLTMTEESFTHLCDAASEAFGYRFNLDTRSYRNNYNANLPIKAGISSLCPMMEGDDIPVCKFIAKDYKSQFLYARHGGYALEAMTLLANARGFTPYMRNRNYTHNRDVSAANGFLDAMVELVATALANAVVHFTQRDSEFSDYLYSLEEPLNLDINPSKASEMQEFWAWIDS